VSEDPQQQTPDVLLDVPNLEVDRITLEVDDLRAHVSVLAELANLVRLSVGADVQLGRVKLEIEGVEAQALLKVRLEHVRATLEDVLERRGGGEGVSRRALEEGPASDTGSSAQEEQQQ
jgi:hypothetical protein